MELMNMDNYITKTDCQSITYCGLKFQHVYSPRKTTAVNYNQVSPISPYCTVASKHQPFSGLPIRPGIYPSGVSSYQKLIFMSFLMNSLFSQKLYRLSLIGTRKFM